MKKFMDRMFYTGAGMMLLSAAIAVLMVIHNVDFIENFVITIILSVATIMGFGTVCAHVGYEIANEEHKEH